MLRRWLQFADQALKEDQAENVLNEFLVQMQGAIGAGALLLAKAFWQVAGPRELNEDFDALATRLRVDGDQSDTRENAEQMYRWLHQLHLNQLRRSEAIRKEGTDALLVLNALLWPTGGGIVLRVLNTDADGTAALRATTALADRDLTHFSDTIRRVGDDNSNRISYMMGLAEQVIRKFPNISQGTASSASMLWAQRKLMSRRGHVDRLKPAADRLKPAVYRQESETEPIAQAHPPEQNDSLFLKVRPGESL